jgi:hypothetical protein
MIELHHNIVKHAMMHRQPEKVAKLIKVVFDNIRTREVTMLLEKKI